MKQRTILTIAAAFITAGSLAAKDIRLNPVEHARLADHTPQDGRADGKPLDVTAMGIRLGDNHLNNICAAVFIFELPDLPENADLLKVETAWRLQGVYGTPQDAQLDMFFKTTGSVTLADYAAPAVSTVKRILTAKTPSGAVRTSDNDMLNAIKKNYNNGAPEFKYVVFRLRWSGGEKFPVSDKNGQDDAYSVFTQLHGNRAWRPELKLTITD
ncbi:MAG: hypothetical protein WC959_09015 [Kiritimatiellales bacterium]